MAPTDPMYPNLRRYLKNWSISHRIRTLKRPETWLSALTALGIVLVLGYGPVAIISVGVAGFALQLFFMTRRPKGRSGFFARIIADGTRLRCQRALRRNGLAELIGETASNILESCAEQAHRARSALFAAVLVGPKLPAYYKDVIRAAHETIEAEMSGAFASLERVLTFQVKVTEENLSELRERETNLARIADEAERLSKALEAPNQESDVSATLSRISAICEAEEQIRLQRVQE